MPHKKDFGAGYAGMGFTMALAILLFGGAGWVVDGWLHTRPLFFIVGTFAGGFAGFMSIYVRVKRDLDNQGPGAGGQGPGPK